jgi:anti-sigma B factor antagonist
MNFIIESKKDITIFRLQEKRLDASLAPELKSQILMLVAEGKKYLIIDLAQVDAIDSNGIGALLIAHRHTAEHEGFAAFIGIHGNVKDLLQMMQLHKQLYIFSSVQEVLRNLEEVDDAEDVKANKVDDDEEEIDALAELDDIDIPDAGDLVLGDGDLEVPEFPDESVAEFSDDDEKPKKRGKATKPSKTSKAKSTKASKKSAPKSKAKKK